MPTTIGQHAVATFTSPVNGTTPIDANTVRGNDNTMRSAYVTHDADPGIHVQSSTLASRPAAGTAGRKWITADAGSYHLYYDDGTRWHEVGGESVELEVVAGENLVKGDVVSVTGYSNGLNLATVAKYTAAAPAFGIASEAITNGSRGYIINTGYITDIATDTFGATGTILYPAATGTFTGTKPTSGTYQVSAYVLRSNSNNGVLFVEFSGPRIVERSDNTASTIVLRDASGDFAAGTITAGAAVVTGDLTVNTSTLKVDSANNRVGIGTATPAHPFQIGATGLIYNTSGDVGIGTASPASFGANYTSVDVRGADGGGLLFGNATDYGYLYSDSSTTSIASVTSKPLVFQTNGTEAMRIDVNGDVRIGTGTPSALLHVEGSDALVPVDFLLRNDSGASRIALGNTTGAARATLTLTAAELFTIGSEAAFPMAFQTNGMPRMTVEASGNVAVDTDTLYVDAANNRVGIGTASPATPLDVTGIFNGAQARFGNTAGRGLYVSTALNGGTNEGSAVLDARGAGSGQFLFQTDSDTKMRLDASGKLSVGTTSAVQALTVLGALTANDAADCGLAILRAGTTYGSNLYHTYNSANSVEAFGITVNNNTTLTDKQYTKYLATSNGIHIWYGGTTADERMRIDASGNVGIGTPTPGQLLTLGKSSGNFYTSFVGDATATMGLLFGTSGNTVDGQILYSNGTQVMSFVTAAAERMRIDGGGNLTAPGVYSATVGGTNRDVFVDNTGLIGYVPSIRASKMDIEPVEDIDWLLALEPVSFHYRKKDENGYTDEPDGVKEYGLIAEDVESVKPELCFYDIVDGEPELRGISYSKLVTPLLALVKQQQARLDALEARLAALEA